MEHISIIPAMGKIKVGVSTCLLGKHVRYDGGHQWDRYLTETLGRYLSWVPVCPEVEYGLSIPREAMHLVGDPGRPRLVTVKTGEDHTEGMIRWAQTRLGELDEENLCGFIFKSKSPSSGLQGVKVYGGPSAAPIRRGTGLFARAVTERFPLLPVEDDGRLHDPVLRENFIERVFTYHHWQQLAQEKITPERLIRFHTKHKLLIMSHSPKHLKALGEIAADAGRAIREGKDRIYLATLMEGLRFIATPKKHTNVLMHMMGYFKKDLTADGKQELLEMIKHFHEGTLPLMVPLTLISHYVRKFGQPYLEEQVYLHPHPMALMLRNHV